MNMKAISASWITSTLMILIGIMVATAVVPIDAREEGAGLGVSVVDGHVVVGEGPICEDACAAAPTSCAACLVASGQLNAFYEEPAPVQRLNLREAGYLDSIAYPVIDLGPYYNIFAGPDAPIVSHIFQRTMNLMNGYDKDAEISMDSGERLPMSTGVSPSLCNLHGNGTTDVGLFGSYYADPLFRAVAGLPPCSEEPGTVDWAPRGDIGFASVSDYATAAAKNGAIECMSDSLDFQEALAERLMDVDDPDTMARELFWATANAATASNGYALFKNATTYADEKWDSIRRCHQAGGENALDQARLRALRDAGRLLVYDLSHLETLSASQEDLPVGNTFGAQAFFEVEDALVDGDRSVKALAICLSTLEDGTSEERTVRVYTPELSPGAFAIAAWHFRASVENYFVFVSHMYELHLRDAVTTYAILNTIDPEDPVGASPHPLRRLTDTFSDPRFNLAFGTNFAASWPRQLEQFYVNEGNALRLWDDYAAGRFDPHGDGEPNTSWNAVDPVKVATERLGLNPEFWGGDDLPGFSVIDVHRRTYALASDLAAEYVDSHWPTDDDVAGDAGLASFAAYIAAPEAGNMPLTGNENGAIRTAAELKTVLANYLYRLFMHAMASHAPFGSQSTVNLVRCPPGMRPGASLPDPATAYSTEQILAFGPTIEQAWLHTDFIANFVATTPFSDRMELVADDLLEGLGPAFAALLATPDTTGGYLINPSGKDFQICSGGRMSPTNIEF